MITSNISKRYARAFFDVAGEKGQYEKYYHELQSFARLMEDDQQLRNFLSNPVFEKEEKRKVIDNILERLKFSPLTANYLRLLADKGRIGGLAGIVESYRNLMDNVLGIARVKVKTAFNLTPALSERLKRSLDVLLGKKVEMEIERDPSLLGGIVIRVGDKVYDGSVKTQLENMRKLLGEEI